MRPGIPGRPPSGTTPPSWPPRIEALAAAAAWRVTSRCRCAIAGFATTDLADPGPAGVHRGRRGDVHRAGSHPGHGDPGRPPRPRRRGRCAAAASPGRRPATPADLAGALLAGEFSWRRSPALAGRRGGGGAHRPAGDRGVDRRELPDLGPGPRATSSRPATSRCGSAGRGSPGWATCRHRTRCGPWPPPGPRGARRRPSSSGTTTWAAARAGLRAPGRGVSGRRSTMPR